MSSAAIRAFGICTFVFEALILFTGIGPREWIFGPPPRARIFYALAFCIVATSVGVGLLLLRKWAAVLFSLALVGLPIWMGIDWFGQVPVAVYGMLFAATGGACHPNHHNCPLLAFIVVAWKIISLMRNITNRWTRAAGACFATSLVRRRVL